MMHYSFLLSLLSANALISAASFGINPVLSIRNDLSKPRDSDVEFLTTKLSPRASRKGDKASTGSVPRPLSPLPRNGAQTPTHSVSTQGPQGPAPVRPVANRAANNLVTNLGALEGISTPRLGQAHLGNLRAPQPASPAQGSGAFKPLNSSEKKAASDSSRRLRSGSASGKSRGGVKPSTTNPASPEQRAKEYKLREQRERRQRLKEQTGSRRTDREREQDNLRNKRKKDQKKATPAKKPSRESEESEGPGASAEYQAIRHKMTARQRDVQRAKAERENKEPSGKTSKSTSVSISE